MFIKKGILTKATQIVSPHFDKRPDPFDISLLVIHNISLPAGDFGGSQVAEFFTGNLDIRSHPSFSELSGVKVSAHLFIRRNGEVIQFVNFNDRAWHAGVSEFSGRQCCNDFSIGIELEGTDDLEYTESQYTQLIEVTIQIMQACPKIIIDNICGHCEIAPDRKTDPGTHFDWKRYKQSL